MASSAITGLLGLVFWAATARLFPADQVGIASALISSAIMLSTLSNLSLGAMYERFLPVCGNRAGRLLAQGFALVTAFALLLAVGLIVLGPRDTLFESDTLMLAYPALVVTLAVFALQDQTVSGLGVARWAAWKNTAHAAAKLAAVIALAWTGSALAILASWGATAAVAALTVLLAMRAKVVADPRYARDPALPPRRELKAYFFSSYGISALGSLAPLVVPLVVVSRIGAEANAYFAVAWSLVSGLFIMVHLMVGPFVAEAAAHPDKVVALSGRFVRTVTALAVVGGVGMAAAGPLALGLVGDSYRENGSPILYLASAFVPLSVVGAVYSGLARVYRRMTLAVTTQCISTVVIIVGSIVLTDAIGVAGVGWAYLVAELGTAVILIGPLISWLSRLRNRARWEQWLAAKYPQQQPRWKVKHVQA
ncbi:lipopolysaccharide biosynthesis protein [Rhodococcus sp. O3]|uniref:lipopolysaccharide biosynthesis protein n=1 Tax=Rhodococcus sp. O3 TaxID=3404919 RepID=UPI003B674BD6